MLLHALGVILVSALACGAGAADKPAASLNARSFTVTGSVPFVAMIRRNLTADTKKRIVDGDEAKAGTRPWQVALVGKAYDNLSGQFCGGTLIAPDWVATAAHCVDGGLKPAQIVIVPGVLSLADPQAKRVDVKRIVVHPKWNASTNDNDVALVEIATAVTAGPNVKPIQFVTSTTDPNAGTTLTVSGWGATKEGGAGSVVLLTTDVPVVTRETCNLKDSYSGGITKNMICAGREQGGRDSCQGDSGGPGVSGAASNPVLIGIVSWGTGCARPKKYGVYTHVGLYADWIKKTSAL